MVSRKDGRRRTAGPAGGGAPGVQPPAGGSSAGESRSGASAGGGQDADPGDEPARPGWPDPLPDRMAWLRREIEQQAFSRAEVVVYWRKAVAKARDATISGLSVDTALEAAYAAGRLAAMAVLASRHVRVRARSGHHALTFSAVAALELPGCDDLVADSEGVRIARHDADYTAEFARPDDLDHALKWVRRTLPVLRAALLAGDPELRPHLPSYP